MLKYIKKKPSNLINLKTCKNISNSIKIKSLTKNIKKNNKFKIFVKN